MSDTNPSEPQHLAHARYLGADAAMAAATWLEVSEADAQSILDDVDPEVMDRYDGPNLSGEWADDPTPQSIAREVGANDGDIAFYGIDLLDDVATAWESGRDDVWGDALQAHALRVVGRIDDALKVERDLESRVSRMREEAGQ
jgi:hypothetical protein